jgi:LPS export ABC transporter protein LptC
MIRISRLQSRVIAFTVIIFALFIGILITRTQQDPKRPRREMKFSGAEITSTGFILNNFQRTEIKDGKTLWVMKADQGEYLKGQDSVKLTNSFLTIYQDNGDVVEVISDSSIMELIAGKLNTAKMIGNVKMNVNKERYVYTQEALYDKNREIITAPGYAKIEDRNIILEGKELSVLIKESSLSFGSNVITTIKRKESL